MIQLHFGLKIMSITYKIIQYGSMNNVHCNEQI